jgi:hypothetical protein
MSLNYFNTTQLSGSELQGCTTQARKQDELVLDVFMIKGRFTPSECWQYLMNTGRIDDHTPLTSIRRSITVLTDKGRLNNTGVKRIGIFGRPENVWKLVMEFPAISGTGKQIELFN